MTRRMFDIEKTDIGDTMARIMDHEDYMIMALEEAHKARKKDEVPIGAVIIDKNGNVVSKAHNQVIHLADPTAHAEMLCIRDASLKNSNYRLLNMSLYVTVEPCVMCMGAVVHSRIEKIFFGANDPKWGAAGSIYNFSNDGLLNHRPEVTGGILQEACSLIIQDFFRSKR